MLNLLPMEELIKLKSELERTKTELGILYEISNAMRTTLNLDEILYIILTGVTAHIGLGFNRALLFLINQKDGLIEGKMGIGPETGEEANRIWSQIEGENMDMEDLISAYKFSNNGRNGFEGGFNKQVQHIKISLRDKSENLLNLVAQEGMPLHLTKETIINYKNTPILQLLKSDELVLIPLKAKDKINGIIVADNFITKEPIIKDDLRMLTMLANQAGLAIENSQLYEKTVMLAQMDALTELWNHGYFQYLLLSELEKSRANQAPLSLILIDIDHFKVYNDTLGHQAGDKILKSLASLLKDQSRKMDLVCRYGGEEFAIILPQTDKKETLLIAERLREDIEKYAFAHEDILPDKRLTASLGISSFPEDGLLPAELISASDKAMYRAKNKGRNTTCY
ncbi:MAG: sensor domain-containing diguanylate cyclase [Candidatus Omnitrophica bacterium]|nr:sensor domain-containing diguanylate cyclase [Candidatus Omnitrophota bacterium]